MCRDKGSGPLVQTVISFCGSFQWCTLVPVPTGALYSSEEGSELVLEHVITQSCLVTGCHTPGEDFKLDGEIIAPFSTTAACLVKSRRKARVDVGQSLASLLPLLIRKSGPQTQRLEQGTVPVTTRPSLLGSALPDCHQLMAKNSVFSLTVNIVS